MKSGFVEMDWPVILCARNIKEAPKNKLQATNNIKTTSCNVLNVDYLNFNIVCYLVLDAC